MPSKVALTINTFQTADGNPVANGSVRIRLNQDGSVDDQQVGSNFTTIPLNSNGVLTGSPTFWRNADISPAGTYYIRLVYLDTGQLISGPSKVTV